MKSHSYILGQMIKNSTLLDSKKQERTSMKKLMHQHLDHLEIEVAPSMSTVKLNKYFKIHKRRDQNSKQIAYKRRHFPLFYKRLIKVTI